MEGVTGVTSISHLKQLRRTVSFLAADSFYGEYFQILFSDVKYEPFLSKFIYIYIYICSGHEFNSHSELT